MTLHVVNPATTYEWIETWPASYDGPPRGRGTPAPTRTVLDPQSEVTLHDVRLCASSPRVRVSVLTDSSAPTDGQFRPRDAR